MAIANRSTIRVLMIPQPHYFRREESGIRRVVEAYHRYGPEFGIKFVGDYDECELKVSHAGTNTENIDVAHLHGLYWTGDHPSSAWEWKANGNVIEAARQARIITVPSKWVAKTIIRDMHRIPTVIGHGIETTEWEHDRPLGDYVLWNKNRSGVDVCDPTPVTVLAGAFPATSFITTFATRRRYQNMRVTGVIPHDQMKTLIQGAGIYLSTTKETFGIGTLEAMASGVPVLGYAYGGNLELIEHGVNGYLAQPNDEEDLIEGLNYCLQHGKTLGQNGREMVRAYTWQAVMEKVAAVYERALEHEAPTVSIIIPSYMYADRVGRAIESALQQTYRDLKDIVVVDDGSTDNGATEAVVKEWSQKDARVVYLRQQNQGVAAARNAGIGYVDTKYVCCLDADDAIEPEFLKRCVAELEHDSSLGLVYTKLRHVLPDGRTGISPWPDEWDFDRQLQRKNQVPTCNVFRRDVWQSLGGYKSRYCPLGAGSEDAEFWTRIGAYGWKCKLATTEPLFIYSLGSGRVSGSKDYNEPDWLAWHPWVEDGQPPFASYATPKRWSHPVRQYDEPLISVIIPVGPGHERVLEDALDSVDAQTLRQWECIVVWDREDNPPQRYLDAYPHVEWLSVGRNYGPGFARNFGAKMSNAPFLLFLDADDRLYFHALERMLEEWDAQEAIIYSDYVGKAFIENPAELSKNLQQNIQWRDEDGLTVIRYETPEYDVNRAQRQPDGDPRRVYTWNLITSLVPRKWHREISGFDEKMESWEDVDYWWRLAKAGKPFRRVAEPLVVYHFYTGGRRDRGLEKHQELFQYLRDKHEKEDIMPCAGCGSRKRSPVPPSRTIKAVAGSSGPAMALLDEEFTLCTYNHPNRGDHTVIGQAVFRNRVEGIHMIRDRQEGYRIHYGFRGGGARFLVHKEDIRIAPHLYVPVETRAEPPRAERQPLSAPESLTDTKEPRIIAPRPEAKRVDLEEVMRPHVEAPGPVVTMEEPVEDEGHADWKAAYSDNGFDWQKVPGVTARIAQALEGYELEDVIDMGEEGLQEINYVGPSRAKAIYRAAMELVSA